MASLLNNINSNTVLNINNVSSQDIILGTGGGNVSIGTGGFTSTLGSTILGISTIGTLSGTSATFSNNLGVTGLITASGGLTSITGQTVNIGTSGTTSPLNVYGLITGTNGLTINSGTTTLSATTISGTSGIFDVSGSRSGVSGVNGKYLRISSGTYTDTTTAASTTTSDFAFNSFNSPVLAATNNSVTTTHATTLYLAPPTAGTNQTITNSYGLWNAGQSRMDGRLFVFDTTQSDYITGTAALIVSGGILSNSKIHSSGGFTSIYGDVLNLSTLWTNTRIISTQFNLSGGISGDATYLYSAGSSAGSGSSFIIGYNTSQVKLSVELVGTSGTFSSTLGVTGLTTLSGGLVSTAGTTTLGATTTTSISSSGQINMNNNKIINLGTPTLSSDAATKNYVDSVAQGLNTKASVIAATIIPGTLSTSFVNGSVIDGVTLVTGDRILIKDQTSGIENGIYTVNATGSPTRTTDFALGSSQGGSYVFVVMGTVNDNGGFVVTNNKGTDIVGTDAIVFTQFSGAGQVIAGTGLTKTGNTLSVNNALPNVTSLGTLTSLNTGALTGTSATFSSTLEVTGVVTLSNLTASQIVATDSSKNLVSIDTIGSGKVVRDTSPTLVTPNIGAATATTLSTGALTGTSATFSSTLGVTGTSTLGVVNTGALSSTTGSFSSTLGVTGVVTLSNLTASQIVATDSSKNLVSIDTIGSGKVVRDTSPTLVTPNIGAATATTLSTGALTGTSATFSSTLNVTGTSTLGVVNTGALSSTTGTFSSTLGVTGTSTLGVVNTGALSSTTGTFSSTLGVTGTSTLGVVNTGALSSTTGTFSSTLGVTGTSTLGVVNTGALSSTSATFSSTLNVTGVVTLSNLTASQIVATDSSKNLVSIDTIGSGKVVRDTSPTLITPNIGAATATTLSTGALTGTSATFSSTLSVTGTSTLGVVNTGALSSTTGSFSSNISVTGNITSTSGSIIIGQNGTYTLGSIYSDVNWGMLFRARQASPSLFEYAFANSVDGKLLTISTNGTVTSTSTTASTSGTTGAYTTPGGISSSNTTDSVSFTNGGGGTILGGFAIAKTLRVGTGINLNSLTASQIVATDSSKNFVSIDITGSGKVVRDTSPILVTPNIGVATGTSLSLSGVLVNGGFDFVLGNTDQSSRGNSGQSRAMVKDATSKLVINFANDFTGGVDIQSALSVTGLVTLNNLTASQIVSTDASKQLISVATTGSGNVVLANTPTLITPILGAATATTLNTGAITGTSATFSGLISANGGITVATGQTVNIGTSGTTSPLNVFGLLTGTTATFDTSLSVTGVGGITSSGLISANAGVTVANGQTVNIGTSGYTSPLNVYGLITGKEGQDNSFYSTVTTASSFNMVMRADNDTGNKLEIYVNGSTRATDGAPDSVTIRNNGGNLNLGSSSQTNNFYGTDINITPNLTTGNVYITKLIVPSTAGFTSTGSANARYDGPGVVGDSGTKTVVAEFRGYTMATGYYSTSDVRIKENIETIYSNKLNKLRPVTYNFIDKQRSNKLQHGLIAQEVEPVYPECINNDYSYIPNIMQMGQVIDKNKFKLTSKNENLKINKELQVYINKGNEKDISKKCKIVNIDENVYTVDIEFDEIFIYGTYENDVKSVNYESFISILISDSQTKEKKIQEQESIIENILQRLKSLEEKN